MNDMATSLDSAVSNCRDTNGVSRPFERSVSSAGGEKIAHHLHEIGWLIAATTGIPAMLVPLGGETADY